MYGGAGGIVVVVGGDLYVQLIRHWWISSRLDRRLARPRLTRSTVETEGRLTVDDLFYL